ncbi:FAD-dependent monooxygenase [Streptomyces noursei]|uniref:FAD-dependent monooxygenase n=1 Tax=Streptomyces noursei TaxID=1971 RepID=UPI0019C1E947|nr:hypothetical protein GCM10010341_58250 [Streptomyces noursei]
MLAPTSRTLTALRGAATRSSDNARQAATYWSGRVLLAGDAAHVPAVLREVVADLLSTRAGATYAVKKFPCCPTSALTRQVPGRA